MVDTIIVIGGLVLFALLSYAFVAGLGYAIDRARRKRENESGSDHRE